MYKLTHKKCKFDSTVKGLKTTTSYMPGKVHKEMVAQVDGCGFGRCCLVIHHEPRFFSDLIRHRDLDLSRETLRTIFVSIR